MKITSTAKIAYALIATLASCSSGGGGSDPTGATLNVTTISGTAGANSILVTWDTNLPSTGELFFGEQAPYTQSIASSSNALHHEVTLTGLNPATTYNYFVRALTTIGLEAESVVQTTATTNGTVASASDDFFANNLNLDRWQLVDPTNSAQVRMLSSISNNGQMKFGVPSGVSSSPWMNLNAARLTQTVQNEDITVQAIFTGAMADNGTGQGFVFEEDENNFARFEFVYNSNEVQLFAAVFAGGSLRDMQYSNVHSGAWTAGAPLGLRVVRRGNFYTQEYSLDGSSWLVGPTLTSNMVVSAAGLMVAAEGSPSPGFTMVVDYFETASTPIINEDGQKAMDVEGPFVHNLKVQALDAFNVQLSWHTDEISSADIQYGRTLQYLDGVHHLTSQQFSQSTTLTSLLADTTYFLRITSMDHQGHSSVTLAEVTTPADNTIGSPFLSVWQSTDNGNGTRTVRFGDLGFAQPQINIQGNVQDADEVRLINTVTLDYQLNGGPWTSLAMGDDRTISYAPWRLANEGDFNVELYLANLTQVPAQGGLFVNDLLLRAGDDEGHLTYQSLRVEIVDGTSWDPNASIDWNEVLNNGGDATDAVQIVDGQWNVENYPGLGPVLRTEPDGLGYDRLVAIGEGQGVNAWSNYEVVLDATVLALDPQGYTTGTSSYGFGFLMRWTGHTSGGNYSQPNHNIYPFGAAFLYRWFDTKERWEFWTGYDQGIEFLPDNDPVIGVRYSVKLNCKTQPLGGTRYRMKQWEYGTPEPSSWTFDRTTPVADTIEHGSFLLVAHNADVAFGNIEVNELP
ncbi:MAG: fibronectin type III domain-containing protein [bacterium]|nr:fibronectin type III domain-containing protein [bacterium]